jgi:phospholipase C
MGYYEPADIPFQRALAGAFTLCDAHHCSVQTGTLSSRVVFMAGNNITPGLTTPADNQTLALFDKAMSPWSLAALSDHVSTGTLPQVSWIIPTPVWSEHPSASSPLQGASYTQQVLDILTSNPEVEPHGSDRHVR